MNENTDHQETVIVGGGQAGLAIAYQLKKRGLSPLILEANERIGDSWRRHWDSLRLFTPAKYDGLPGMRFPARRWSFPTKDEMGDYLERYAERFGLATRTGVKVERVSKDGERFVVEGKDLRLEADRVVIASGAHQIPKVPPFADELDAGIVQMHSSAYRSPAQLADGPVLVVGAGNSGAEIAFELARTRETLLAGTEAGQIPVRHGSFAARLFLPVFRFFGTHVLTLGTPIGRKAAPRLAGSATPLIRVKTKELADAGVERVSRVAGVRNGLPVLEDGRVLDVANVIWCTGYRQDYSWVDLPVFDEHGLPEHERGVVHAAPGLFFMGLLFQYAATSDVLPGVGRDAKHVAEQIALGVPANGKMRAPWPTSTISTTAPPAAGSSSAERAPA